MLAKDLGEATIAPMLPRRPTVDANLAVDAGDMVAHGVPRKCQALRDSLVIQPLADQRQHLTLPRRQPCTSFLSPLCGFFRWQACP